MWHAQQWLLYFNNWPIYIIAIYLNVLLCYCHPIWIPSIIYVSALCSAVHCHIFCALKSIIAPPKRLAWILSFAQSYYLPLNSDSKTSTTKKLYSMQDPFCYYFVCIWMCDKSYSWGLISEAGAYVFPLKPLSHIIPEGRRNKTDITTATPCNGPSCWR